LLLTNPPNNTTREPSVAIAGSVRVSGAAELFRWAQFEPSHSQVLLSEYPPNITTLAPKVAIANRLRPCGVVMGLR